MERIVIDLDVVTVYLWKGSQAADAIEFVKEVESKKFEVIVPYTLIELAKKWQYAELKEKIINFYYKNSSIVNVNDIEEKLEHFGVNDKELTIKLLSNSVKEEDAALVITASLFNASCLVTFNRKHLRNKEKEIGAVLKSFNLPELKIRSPKEFITELRGEKWQ